MGSALLKHSKELSEEELLLFVAVLQYEGRFESVYGCLNVFSSDKYRKALVVSCYDFEGFFVGS